MNTGSSAFVPLLHYALSNEVQAIPPKAVINWWSTRLLPEARRCSILFTAQPAREAIGRRTVRDLAQIHFGNRSQTTAAPLNK